MCRNRKDVVILRTAQNVCTPRKFLSLARRVNEGETTNLDSQRTRGGSVQGFKVSALLGRCVSVVGEITSHRGPPRSRFLKWRFWLDRGPCSFPIRRLSIG